MSEKMESFIQWTLIPLLLWIGILSLAVLLVYMVTGEPLPKSYCKKDCEIEHHLEYQNYYKEGNICLCKTGEGTGLVNIYE